MVSEIVPFPPRIEVSTLGDTGILVGALNIATQLACDRVFQEIHKPAGVIRGLAGSM